jgi:hypothetical protein
MQYNDKTFRCITNKQKAKGQPSCMPNKMGAFLFLLVCGLSGCYVPVITSDLSALGDNLVDCSIKTALRTNTGTKTTNDFNQEFRTLFVSHFPLMSPINRPISYLNSIGAICSKNIQNNRILDICTYKSKWPRVRKSLFSQEVIGEVTGIVSYELIEAGDGNVSNVNVRVEFN